MYGSGSGRFELYEDDGESLRSDEPGQHALTTLTHTVGADGVHHLVIEPEAGTFTGQPALRSYELRLHGAGKPTAVSVNGAAIGHWSYDAAHATASVVLAKRPVGERLEIEWR